MTSVQSFGSTRSRPCFRLMIPFSGASRKGYTIYAKIGNGTFGRTREMLPIQRQSLSDWATIGYDTSCSFYHGFISLAHSEPFGEMNPGSFATYYFVMAYVIFLKIRFSRAHCDRQGLLHAEMNCHNTKSFHQLRREKFISGPIRRLGLILFPFQETV